MKIEQRSLLPIKMGDGSGKGSGKNEEESMFAVGCRCFVAQVDVAVVSLVSDPAMCGGRAVRACVHACLCLCKCV